MELETLHEGGGDYGDCRPAEGLRTYDPTVAIEAYSRLEVECLVRDYGGRNLDRGCHGSHLCL